MMSKVFLLSFYFDFILDLKVTPDIFVINIYEINKLLHNTLKALPKLFNN